MFCKVFFSKGRLEKGIRVGPSSKTLALSRMLQHLAGNMCAMCKLFTARTQRSLVSGVFLMKGSLGGKNG